MNHVALFNLQVLSKDIGTFLAWNLAGICHTTRLEANGTQSIKVICSRFGVTNTNDITGNITLV
jgi:hypothetical protein